MAYQAGKKPLFVLLPESIYDDFSSFCARADVSKAAAAAVALDELLRRYDRAYREKHDEADRVG